MSIYLYFPPPANWQDFQILACRAAINLCDEATIHEYGRQGQRQNGVDVHGQMFDGRQLGLQCKEMKPSKKLTKKMIKDEADLALSFKPPLDIFIVTTTLPNDVDAYDAVAELNATGKYHFNIAYWAWDHYVDLLNRSTQLVESAYKSYAAGLGFDEQQSHLMALYEAFNRPCFLDDFAYELNNVDFVNALSDLQMFLKSGLLRDGISKQLISSTYAIKMLPKGDQKDLTMALLTDLEDLRKNAIKDLKGGFLNTQKSDFYNALRKVIIVKLNRKLAAGKLPVINISY